MRRGRRTSAGLVGLAFCLVAAAGCGADDPVDSTPPATEPPTTQAPPVFPTGGVEDPTGSTQPIDGGYDACELLPPDDLAQITGLSDPKTQPSADQCGYAVDGQTVFRISMLTYPQAAGAEQVLETTVSTFDDVEHVSDVGDAAAYVPAAGFGPSLFVVVADGQEATVLTLAFDSDAEIADAPEATDQLTELGKVAAANL